MDYGVLGAYFDGAVAKTLAGVDIMGANKSHQHELNCLPFLGHEKWEAFGVGRINWTFF